MQATNDFSDFVQQEHKKLVEAVDKEVSGLSNFCRSDYKRNSVCDRWHGERGKAAG